MIGAYIDQLHQLGEYLDAPIIQGSTTNKERERLFDAFRSGEVTHAGHLEGRQLLHRPARGGGGDPGVGHVRLTPGGGPAPGPGAAPKADGRQAHFYTVVSRDTIDTEYAAHRQRFLAEQGYAYTIVDADDVLGPPLPTVD